jgi:pyridoxine 4-dehydrogenase
LFVKNYSNKKINIMTREFESRTFILGGKKKVNRLGFGAMRITGEGVWGPPKDKNNAIKVLKTAVKLGINFIDTADAYGPYISEELIAEALYPYPDDLVIATKGGSLRSGPGQWERDGSPKHLRDAIEGSLKRLRLERIELYQLHAIDSKVLVEDSVGTLADLQKEGKINMVGVSNFKVGDLKKVKGIANIVSVQNRYNLSYKVSEPVIDYCEENNMGFIPWFPLNVGNLAKDEDAVKTIADKYNAAPSQIALSWLLKRSDVMLPIPGTSSIEHLDENTRAYGISLNDEDFQKLEREYSG